MVPGTGMKPASLTVFRIDYHMVINRWSQDFDHGHWAWLGSPSRGLHGDLSVAYPEHPVKRGKLFVVEASRIR